MPGSNPQPRTNLQDVGPRSHFAEESAGVARLHVLLDLVRHDERDLGDLGDHVALGHDERRAAGGGDRGDQGVALLRQVDPAVPAPPHARRGEHAPAATHVPEGALARPVGAAPPHAGDPGHGATRAPRLRRRLVA